MMANTTMHQRPSHQYRCCDSCLRSRFLRLDWCAYQLSRESGHTESGGSTLHTEFSQGSSSDFAPLGAKSPGKGVEQEVEHQTKTFPCLLVSKQWYDMRHRWMKRSGSCTRGAWPPSIHAHGHPAFTRMATPSPVSHAEPVCGYAVSVSDVAS